METNGRLGDRRTARIGRWRAIVRDGRFSAGETPALSRRIFGRPHDGMLWRAPMAGRLSRLGTTKSPYYRKSRRDADAKAIPRSIVDRYAQRRLWPCCRAARGSLDSRSATGRRQSHARDDGIFDHRTRDARTIGGKVGAVVGDALRG